MLFAFVSGHSALAAGLREAGPCCAVAGLCEAGPSIPGVTDPGYSQDKTLWRTLEMERVSSAHVRVSHLTWGSLTTLLIAVAVFVGAIDGQSETDALAPLAQFRSAADKGLRCAGFRSVLARWKARCLVGFKRQRDVMGSRDRSSQRVRTLAARNGSSHWPFHRTDASWPRGQ